MAKKKSKKANKLIIPIGIAVVVVIVVVLAITMIITPNDARLKANYEKKGQTIGIVGEVDKKPTLGIGHVDAVLTGGNISANSTGFVITYYTTADKAKEGYKKAKELNTDSDIVVARRGNAVYVGSKSIAGTFKYQIG